MDFLCDVHISLKLVRHLANAGHTALHVNRLPNKWNTSDSEICIYADTHKLILITKDEDFRNSFLLKRTPKKLIRIILGNISNQDLVELLDKNLPVIYKLNQEKGFYLELGKSSSVYTF
ncbi:DUF5615 family PIN-like protein [Dyadobacter sp. CY312]|uniref:DUF5615 family PIN-like protein n=1 Tax=Dyadobacter sp. CY312 TaxID=2907303 RepID=UPI001F40A667|nr:DUF5615 family PIN-like protein [Dyadobacter sp. CY312]MCE7039766.1 DUF5615 family PIN-like protein [Dyadobacter sp. CY312]